MAGEGALRQIFALFDVDTGAAGTKLDKLHEKTSVIKEGLGALASTALGAFSLHGIEGFLSEMIDLGSELSDVSDRLGVSTDELQKFQFAAGQAGVSAEGSATALQFLNKNIGDALAGQKESVQAFADLGVQIKEQNGDVRELGSVLPDVADAFAQMGSDQERTTKAMQLFGRSGAAMIPFLKQGSSEVKELYKQFEELGLGIDEDFIKSSDEAGDQIDTLKLGFRALKTRIAVEVLPGIIDFVKKLQRYVKIAKDIARDTNIVKYVWQALGLAAVATGAKVFYSWSKVLGLFKGGKGLISGFFEMGALGLALAAFLIIALAIEDIVTFAKGGKSVLGDFFDSMGMVEEKRDLIASLNSMWGAMKVSIVAIGPAVAQLMTSFGVALPYIIGLVADLLKSLLTIGNIIFGVGEMLGHLVIGDFKGLDKAFGEGADRQASFWQDGSTFYNIATAKNKARPSDVAPSAAGVDGSAGAPNVSQNNSTVINVNGAKDPAEVGRQIVSFQRGTQQDYNDAAANLARGPE